MLDFFITNAFAQEAVATASKQSSMLASIAPLVLIMAVFYFLIIRPQNKRAKDHSLMLKALNKGDQVITSGGIFGEVAKVDNDKNIVLIQIADNVKIKLKQESIVEIIKPQISAQPA